MKRHLRWIALAVLLVGPASVAGGRTPGASERPAGEGVICSLAIYSLADQVGRRCFPGQDAAMQAEIGRAVDKLDRYVLANGWTARNLSDFKHDQTWVDEPTEKLCKGDTLQLYQSMKAADRSTMDADLDTLVSRPGEPSWGTCL